MKLALALVLPLSLVACGGAAPDAGTSNEAATATEPAKDAPLTSTKKEIKEISEINLSVTYPEFSGSLSSDALTALNEAVAAHAKKLADDARSGAVESGCQKPPADLDAGSEDPSQLCDFQVDCEATYQTTALVSVRCSGDSFFGGAHPDFEYSKLNYTIGKDKVTPVDLSALFGAGDKWKEPLTKLVKDAVTKESDPQDPYTPEDIEMPSTLDNFVISPKGLEFADIDAPHVVGPQAGTVAWADLSSLIPSSSPVAKLAKATAK